MRNPMFDVLKGAGIISVILSHVYRGGHDPLAVFIRELAMWSVPMFFMVQGYFMYGPQHRQWLQSSWKKIKKSYIPYLYWAVAYGTFFYLTAGKTFTVGDLILGKTSLHLYYMFYYIVFALFCPLLYFLPKLWRTVTLWLMIISNVYWVFMLEICKTYDIHWISYTGPAPVKWWAFIAIGMLLAEYPQAVEYIAKHARGFFIGAVSIALIGIVEPYANDTLAYFFNKLAIFPLSIGTTLALAIYYSTENAIGKSFLAYVGERTFGIYLGHFFLVDILRIEILPGDRFLVAVLILFTCLLVKKYKDRFTMRYPRIAAWV